MPRARRGRGTPARRRPAWRETFDSFGGFLALGLVVAIVAVIGFLVTRTPLGFSVSEDPLLGDAVTITSSEHVTSAAEMVIPPGAPPAGGPHFATPLPTGFYDTPVADGNAVHSLEHGVVWASYNPALLTDSDVAELRRFQDAFGGDLIVSPRPENDDAVTIVSWGRILRLDGVDRERLDAFVRTNRNRSPEPGVR